MPNSPQPLEDAMRQAGVACLKLEDGNRKFLVLKGRDGSAAFWITLGGGNGPYNWVTLFGAVPIALSDQWINTHGTNIERLQQSDIRDVEQVWTHRVHSGALVVEVAKSLKTYNLVSGHKLAETEPQGH